MAESVQDFLKGVSVANSFKLISSKALDARLVVKNMGQLNALKENNAAYPGMEVWVRSENKQYCFLPFTAENTILTEAGALPDHWDFTEKPSGTVSLDDTTKNEIVNMVASKMKKINGGTASTNWN